MQQREHLQVFMKVFRSWTLFLECRRTSRVCIRPYGAVMWAVRGDTSTEKWWFSAPPQLCVLSGDIRGQSHHHTYTSTYVCVYSTAIKLLVDKCVCIRWRVQLAVLITWWQQGVGTLARCMQGNFPAADYTEEREQSCQLAHINFGG